MPIYQPGWRWCDKCSALHFGANTNLGNCAAGGEHRQGGTTDYQVFRDPAHTDEAVAQANWRNCKKCGCLFWAKNNIRDGVCPISDGLFVTDGVLQQIEELIPIGAGQDVRGVSAQIGQALRMVTSILVNTHDGTGSSNYQLQTQPIPGFQVGWRWCRYCGVLFWSWDDESAWCGAPHSAGSCPGNPGGEHVALVGGYNYSLTWT